MKKIILVICLFLNSNALFAVKNSQTNSNIVYVDDLLNGFQKIEMEASNNNSSIAKKALEQLRLSYENEQHRIVNPAVKNYLERYSLVVKNKIRPAIRNVEIDPDYFL